jgi:hypothetical protein
MQDHAEQDRKSGDVPEQSSSKHSITTPVNTTDSPPPASLSDSEVNPSRTVPALISIKREPDYAAELEEPPSSPLRITAPSKSDNHGELKRRLSSHTIQTNCSGSKWNGAENELTLTAYDVIAGVINTHPIQPLEQDADSAHATASPPRKGGMEMSQITQSPLQFLVQLPPSPRLYPRKKNSIP